MKRDFPIFETCSLSPRSREEIFVSRFSAYINCNKNLLQPHRHSFYHLAFFTEGKGSHTIDFSSFDIKSHQIYFMIPGQIQNYICENNVEGYVINFSVPFFNSFLLRPNYIEQFPYFNGILANSVIDVPEHLQMEIISLFERILGESGRWDKMGMDMLKAMMIQLFIHIGRLASHVATDQCLSYKFTLLRKFLKLVDTNLLMVKLPRDYAEMLFITPNHLNSLCNEILGKSTGEIIRDKLILEAKRLIVNYELSISEISNKLNFYDNSYFTKFFKKHTTMTPEEFRETIKLRGNFRMHSHLEFAHTTGNPAASD
jgi:AraC family transcriptional activator of pobA